jgi:hypothetical protein
LKAVLLRRALPGLDERVIFPDLCFILRQPTVVLLDENLAGRVTMEEPPGPVRVRSREDLVREARARGDIMYLAFRPAQREDKSVTLTLEARIAPKDAAQLTSGLSGVQVKFEEVGGQWEATEEPVFFAT